MNIKEELSNTKKLKMKWDMIKMELIRFYFC